MTALPPTVHLSPGQHSYPFSRAYSSTIHFPLLPTASSSSSSSARITNNQFGAAFRCVAYLRNLFATKHRFATVQRSAFARSAPASKTAIHSAAAFSCWSRGPQPTAMNRTQKQSREIASQSSLPKDSETDEQLDHVAVTTRFMLYAAQPNIIAGSDGCYGESCSVTKCYKVKDNSHAI